MSSEAERKAERRNWQWKWATIAWGLAFVVAVTLDAFETPMPDLARRIVTRGYWLMLLVALSVGIIGCVSTWTQKTSERNPEEVRDHEGGDG